jgi:hypothetical protein
MEAIFSSIITVDLYITFPEKGTAPGHRSKNRSSGNLKTEYWEKYLDIRKAKHFQDAVKDLMGSSYFIFIIVLY